MAIARMFTRIRHLGRRLGRHALLVAAVAASGCLDHTPTFPEQSSMGLASTASQSGPSQTAERGNPNGTPLRASVDSIVTYWNSGARKHAVSSSAPRALGGGGAGLPRESMEAMKGNLEQVSWRFKGGRSDVALMMRLADALTASTREEYRSHLAALPVTMRTAPVVGHNGIPGFRRDVYVYGVRKLSVYLSWGSRHAGRSHSGAIGVAPLASGEMCQDELNGEIIVDECATDDDHIEAELILAALDYEVEALRSQMNAAVGGIVDLRLLFPIGLVVFGCAEFAWAAWDVKGAPRSMMLQGVLFIELGLAFVVLEALSPGVMRTSLASAFALSAIWTGTAQHRVMRAERRGQQGGTHADDG